MLTEDLRGNSVVRARGVEPLRGGTSTPVDPKSTVSTSCTTRAWVDCLGVDPSGVGLRGLAGSRTQPIYSRTARGFIASGRSPSCTPNPVAPCGKGADLLLSCLSPPGQHLARAVAPRHIQQFTSQTCSSGRERPTTNRRSAAYTSLAARRAWRGKFRAAAP